MNIKIGDHILDPYSIQYLSFVDFDQYNYYYNLHINDKGKNKTIKNICFSIKNINETLNKIIDKLNQNINEYKFINIFNGIFRSDNIVCIYKSSSLYKSDNYFYKICINVNNKYLLSGILFNDLDCKFIDSELFKYAYYQLKKYNRYIYTDSLIINYNYINSLSIKDKYTINININKTLDYTMENNNIICNIKCFNSYENINIIYRQISKFWTNKYNHDYENDPINYIIIV